MPRNRRQSKPPNSAWSRDSRNVGSHSAAFLTELNVARNLFQNYREIAGKNGWAPGPTSSLS